MASAATYSLIVAAVVLVASASGCGVDEGAPLQVDERRGTVNGVGIGDGVATMRRSFGPKRAADTDEPASPLSVDVGEYEGPSYFNLGPPFYRYEHVTFFVERGRIVGFMALGDAQAASGIATGDQLDKVKDAHPRARCGEAPSGEYGHYPACVIRLAPRRFIWFGGDPISTIMVGIRRLEGV
jgi:hypothetical protein